MPHRGFHDAKNGSFSTIDGICRNRHYPLTPEKSPQSEQHFFENFVFRNSEKKNERKNT
jgi:hypothetical protein